MTKNIYQVKIVLIGSKPKIWRTLLVPSDLLLPDFHEIIQTAMGWENEHLHHFIKDNTFYTVKMKGDPFWDDLNNVDHKSIPISKLLTNEKETIIYEYDFGDQWEHDITLEKILPVDDKIKYPVCLKGKMNCPPEDCGGVWGYLDMLEIIEDPDHPEHENFIEWIGGEFDPKYFDKEKVNEMLKTKNYGCR